MPGKAVAVGKATGKGPGLIEREIQIGVLYQRSSLVETYTHTVHIYAPFWRYFRVL